MSTGTTRTAAQSLALATDDLTTALTQTHDPHRQQQYARAAADYAAEAALATDADADQRRQAHSYLRDALRLCALGPVVAPRTGAGDVSAA